VYFLLIRTEFLWAYNVMKAQSCKTHGHILLSHLRLPQPGGPGPVFISPRNRVAKLYPRALGTLFVASYDSHGYAGGILTFLNTGLKISVQITRPLYHTKYPSRTHRTIFTLTWPSPWIKPWTLVKSAVKLLILVELSLPYRRRSVDQFVLVSVFPLGPLPDFILILTLMTSALLIFL
jgi:hypothetical protein